MYVVAKKRQAAKALITEKCGCKIGCIKCLPECSFVDKLADANVPAGYWFKKMVDFKGPPNIKRQAIAYAKDIKANFQEGTSLCFTGNLGTGKTYSCCTILKTAIKAGFDVYYTTFSDLVFYLTDHELKKEYYSKVSRADFLCVDEIDARHCSGTEQSLDFFGRTFERIFRYRIQNNLPILMATNNASLDEAFAGQFKRVVESLHGTNTIIVPALGTDYRLRKVADV